MEEIFKALSERLAEAGTNGYKIYYEDELLECIPEDLRNRETLEATLKKLDGEGYIDVKYARGDVFCIREIEKYVPREEVEIVDETSYPMQAISFTKLYLFTALGALFGGLLGGCTVALVMAVT